MSLRAPILDDRSFVQLRDELLRMIPIYSKEWTDHNASDPGVTLLELFAFLGENLLFRFNQIPEATRAAYLELLRIPLHAAQPATALLACTTDGAPVLVSKGTAARAKKIVFETTTEVTAHPVDGLGAARVQSPVPSDGDRADFARRSVDAAELSSGEQPAYYETRTLDLAQRPDEVLDVARTVDGMLWVAVLAPKAPADDLERRALADALAEQWLNVGVAFDQRVASMSDVDACPGAGDEARPPETIWEVSLEPLGPDGRPRYVALAERGDTTRGLTTTGVVRLELPRADRTIGVPEPDDADLFGARDFPPFLEDDELSERVLFWLRAYRRADGPHLARVRWVGLNATEVVQARTAEPELLGTGNGQPDQRFELVHRPVLPSSLVVEVEERRGHFVAYERVDGFWASTELDRHYVLDPEAGAIRFGRDRGRAPQIGERIRAATYRYGGGTAGNVPAKAIDRLDGVGGVECTNPLRAINGTDTENLESGLARIPGELRRRDRLVTEGDAKELAAMTPGVAIGRTEVLANFYPPTRTLQAAGVVSVVVWPAVDPAHPAAPMPDRPTLDAVCRWLDERRLVTTELWVIPPTYRRIAVAVGLEAKPGYGVDAVRNWVELVVRQYLAPLPPYGPEGDGWPLGRAVMGRELEAAALQVEGVRFLTDDVRVATYDDASASWVRASADIVELLPWEVAELAEITVVDGPPLDPGEAIAPDLEGRVPVPIPVLVDEC